MKRDELKVGIVIPNFNGGGELVKCIKMVERLELSKRVKVTTFLIDNNSTDGSEKMAKKQFGKLHLVKNKQNLGFAKAANQGARLALEQGANLVLFLNPDAYLTSRALEKLIKKIKPKNIGIVGPVLKHQVNKRTLYDYGGKLDTLIGRADHINKSSFKKGACQNRDFVSGACVLVKRTVFEKVGFFDENFFLYFEDADFCLRALKKGFKVKVCPGSVVSHQTSTSAKKIGKKRYKHLLKSNFRFILKHLGIKIPLGVGYLVLLAVKIWINQRIKND